jgi:malonate transporter
MAGVHLEQLDWKPVLAYFLGVGLIFFGTLLTLGGNRRAAVLALATTYSNLVMIGIPLVGLAYGEAGLVTLLTLVSLHALVLLVSATVALELALMGEGPSAGSAPWRTIVSAVRDALIHPVPLPILAGLLFAQTGWSLPPWLDAPMGWIGQAFGPLALMLVGLTLAGSRIGEHLRAALVLVAVKNLLMPALVLAIAWSMGVQGIALTVLMVAAALPIGANVFLFAQRYQVAQAEVTAGVALSTTLALLTVSLLMALRA